MSNPPFLPSKRFSDKLGEVRASVAAEGPQPGLAGAVQRLILLFLEMLAELLAAMKEGRLAAGGLAAISHAPSRAAAAAAERETAQTPHAPGGRSGEVRRPIAGNMGETNPARPAPGADAREAATPPRARAVRAQLIRDAAAAPRPLSHPHLSPISAARALSFRHRFKNGDFDCPLLHEHIVTIS